MVRRQPVVQISMQRVGPAPSRQFHGSGPGVCYLEAGAMRGTQSELGLQGMVIRRCGVGVIRRGPELGVGDEVVFRETAELRRNCRADRGLAVSQAVTPIAEDTAAQV